MADVMGRSLGTMGDNIIYDLSRYIIFILYEYNEIFKDEIIEKYYL